MIKKQSNFTGPGLPDAGMSHMLFCRLPPSPFPLSAARPTACF